MRTSVGKPHHDVEALYRASYGRLVAVVGAVAQDRYLAEEAVQHAFSRLIDKWETVHAYDDVEAWLRKVAFGYVSNRRRKVSRGFHAMARHGAGPHTAAPTGDAVDLRRALQTLPMVQRQVIILRQLGMSTQEMADGLGIPLGTVKSRLSRAHAALLPLLREDLSDYV